MYVSRYACRPISIVEKDQAMTVRDLAGLVLKVAPVSESETTNAEFQT